MSTEQQFNIVSHVKRALSRAYLPEAESREASAAWREYYALLKDAEAYRNFWHPIQSCPKDSNILYLLANKGKGRGKNKIRVGKWRDDLRAWGNATGHCNSKSDPDYYAEIPPLPKAQAQDEVKP